MVRFKILEIMPLDNRIRYYHYEHEDGMGILMFVNEGIRDYRGTVRFLTDVRYMHMMRGATVCLKFPIMESHFRLK